jgi:hypothetical protein
MRGQAQTPFGWAALALVVVAYAHVILEIVVAMLAVAVAARVAMSPAPGLAIRQLHRYRRAHELEKGMAAVEGDAMQRAPGRCGRATHR